VCPHDTGHARHANCMRDVTRRTHTREKERAVLYTGV